MVIANVSYKLKCGQKEYYTTWLSDLLRLIIRNKDNISKNWNIPLAVAVGMQNNCNEIYKYRESLFNKRKTHISQLF